MLIFRRLISYDTAFAFEKGLNIPWFEPHDVTDFDVRQALMRHPVLDGARSDPAKARHIIFSPIYFLGAILNMLCHVRNNGIGEELSGRRLGLFS